MAATTPTRYTTSTRSMLLTPALSYEVEYDMSDLCWQNRPKGSFFRQSEMPNKVENHHKGSFCVNYIGGESMPSLKPAYLRWTLGQSSFKREEVALSNAHLNEICKSWLWVDYVSTGLQYVYFTSYVSEHSLYLLQTWLYRKYCPAANSSICRC